jgi:hypothetical protein
MEFKEGLQKSLIIDKHTCTDPFLLHSRVCDLVGNDYEAKKAAEEFYRLDAKYEISKTILRSAPVRCKKRKKHYYKIKPMPIPPDNAYVFFASDSRTLHLSRECPKLKNNIVYRSFYDFARYSDYIKTTKQRYYRYESSKAHRPPICRCCGNFEPTFARSFIDKIRAFLYNTFGIGRPVQLVYSPYYE